MPLIILLLILLLPVAELTVLIDVGDEIGAISTVALCLLTAAVGLSLVRLQGIKVFTDAQAAASRGEPVGASLVHGFFLAVAGVMLFIPGFLTDAVGALLLIPPVRLWLGGFVLRRMMRGGHGTYSETTIIIDGDFQPADEHGRDNGPDVTILPPERPHRHSANRDNEN